MHTPRTFVTALLLMSPLAGCLDHGVQTPASADATDAVETRPDASVASPDAGATRPDVGATGPDASPPAATTGAVEGDRVVPQTLLHLRAAWPAGEDRAADDEVTQWAWSVVQPEGSVSLFQPSAFSPSPMLEANVAGHYTFTVAMTTASGATRSATFLVVVVPDSALHVELLWHTPGDDNESDTGMTSGGINLGSDVDLHVVHYAADGMPPDGDGDGAPDGLFFNDSQDCFWLSTDPNWASSSATDNPSLDRDDTDGAGPENMNLDVIQPGQCYHIGVHYWDDWGYGVSDATVRVYIMGVLAYEATTNLANHDLWQVGRLCADDPQVQSLDRCDDAGCTPSISPNFPVPLNSGYPFSPGLP